MARIVRARLIDGPLVGKWRSLEVDSSGLPPVEFRVYGLLGVPESEGGVHRCAVYRRMVNALLEDGEWPYAYDRDEPYRPFPVTP